MEKKLKNNTKKNTGESKADATALSKSTVGKKGTSTAKQTETKANTVKAKEKKTTKVSSTESAKEPKTTAKKSKASKSAASKKTEAASAAKSKTTEKEKPKKTATAAPPKKKAAAATKKEQKASTSSAPVKESASSTPSSEAKIEEKTPSPKPKKSSLQLKDLTFKVGEYIFYPSEGLGKITDIEIRTFENEKTPYYVIRFISQKMTSRVPAKNIHKLRIRKILSKATVIKILESLETLEFVSNLSWKDRLLKHQEVIKKGNTQEIAEMLTSLHIRSIERPLSFQERQYYDLAFEALSDEFSVVLDKGREEIKTHILELLDANAKSKQAT